MTKFNKFFLTVLGVATLGLSACGSIERKTASSSQQDEAHYSPKLFDR